MSEVQRIIKYCATAFALFLAFSILSGIMYGIIMFGTIFEEDNKYSEELKDLEVRENASILDIDIKGTNLVLKEGDTFKVETNNKYVKTKQNKNKLHITEKSHNWFQSNKKNDLVVYIPKDLIFDGVSIDSGAGTVEIDALSTENLYLDLGAGKVNINHLTVLRSTDIEGGAGEIQINNGSLNNLDLDGGVGKLTLTAMISGKSEIDAGVGEVNLNLIGSLEEYRITLDKGIGSATLNQKKMYDEEVYGNGNNSIDIDGGVGSLKINFVD